MKKLSVLTVLVFVAAFLVAQHEICPLLPGSALPRVEVTGLDGKMVSLETAMGEGPAIVLFYRGSWCPYCNGHFRDLREIEQDLQDLGYRLVALSPDQPVNGEKTLDKTETGFSLYSDSDMLAADAFGLSYVVNEKTIKLYKTLQLDLEIESGRTHGKLPVPGVFIFDKKHILQFTFAHPDYKTRLAPEVLLAAAKAALK